MGKRKRFWCLLLLCVLLAPRTSHLTPRVAEAAHLEERNGLRVGFLDGSPYELGYQHGRLLKDEVRQSVGQVLGYFRGYLKLPVLGSLAANWWLDRPWIQAMPFVPGDALEELRGLAEGAGVPVRELWRLHAIPDRTYACSNFAAWGRATAGGRLIHARNLDWNIRAGIQQHAAVFVVRPTGQQAFVNVGWAGFIGVLSGINEQQVSIGQIGAATVDATWKGMPMVFVMRQVLERASTLGEAVRIIQDAPRTVGANYVIADAKVPTALAVETTHRRVSAFEADDPKEQGVSYAAPLGDCVFRADTAVDPQIRDWQVASGGNPKTPGLEPPTGSAYAVRYLGQGEGLRQRYGRLDAAGAIAIAKTIAPDSNVQSVVFAWPIMWVANAQDTPPAAKTTYHELDLEDLFNSSGQLP